MAVTSRFRRRVWLLILPTILPICDSTITLCGQPSEYWAGARELFLPGTAPQDCPEHHGGVVGLIDKVGRWLGSH